MFEWWTLKRSGSRPGAARFGVWAVAWASMVLAIGACSGNGSSSVDLRRENVFVFGRGQDSVGLDPAHEDDGESFNVTGNIYDTLVRFKVESTEVEPSLAESWEISEDGKVYTFHLLKGVTFHDGTPFNADAVLFSFLRQHDPKHEFADVGGPYKYWDNMGMSQIVKAIEKVDDLTVRFRLVRSEAPFLANLAMNFASIVSPTAVVKMRKQFNFHPVGTGPFMFESWQRGQKIVLRKNPHYFGGPVKLDKVVFAAIPDNSVRFQAFKAGKLDGFNFPNPFELDAIRSSPGVRFLTQEGMNICYLALNTQKPPFDNVLVRRAINYAINKQAIIDNFYQGLGTVAKNPLPPVVWGYHKELVPYSYDPAKARELLAEAGFPDGFETTLWAMSNPRPYILAPDKVAAAVIADLEQIGVRARKVTYDWPTYLEKTDHGQHDMAFLGWSGDNGDPDNFLYMLLSKTGATIPATNIAFYRSDAFTDLLEKAKVLTDQNQRAALYRQAQEIFHRDAPWVPVAHSVQVMIVRDNVEGFHLHPTSRVDFRGVSIRRP